MKRWLYRVKRNQGQTLVEYALILAFISIVAISVMISLSSAVHKTYTSLASSLASAQSSH
jgi:Flp pilus assembly pilin Flp